jgi:CubicO group peptidase (beta-lactamase class C family)
MRSTATLLALLLLPALSSAVPPAAEPDRPAAIDALFAEWDRPDSPGAAVAVVEGGEIAFARGYGIANLEYDIPITPSTVFHIASVSKQFTAFAVHLLAAEGKLSLDDQVRAHVPELHDYGVPITLRQLIHHTSGLRDQWELLAMAGWRLDDVITREQIVKIVGSQRELNFPPGSEFLYSNSGYTLLALVVERVSGESFPQFAERRIFEPLGMTSTHFHDDHKRIVRNRAYSYGPLKDGGLEARPLNYANAGATSLFTTVEDLARWDANFREPKAGNAAILASMHERGVLNGGRELDYAHALSHQRYRGSDAWGHGGADAGYRSHYLRFPQHDVSVIVFSNLASFNAGSMARKVADVWLADRLDERPAYLPARPFRMRPEQMRRFTGSYASPLNVIRHLEFRDGRLALTSPVAVELTPVAANRFQGVSGETTFDITFDGNPVSGFTLLAAGSSEPQKFERFEQRTPPFEELAGLYYSEELGTEYVIEAIDDAVVVRHRRHEDARLVPTFADRFTTSGDAWWIRDLHFTRNEEGRVTGFLLSGNRVRNVRFDRRDY